MNFGRMVRMVLLVMAGLQLMELSLLGIIIVEVAK